MTAISLEMSDEPKKELYVLNIWREILQTNT